MPYIEYLGDFWGALCTAPEIASQWADEFLPLVQHAWAPSTEGFRFFKGTTACLSALHAAGRHDELLSLIATARYQWWHDRRWGVKSLVALGRSAEAIAYAEATKGINTPTAAIASACERQARTPLGQFQQVPDF